MQWKIAGLTELQQESIQRQDTPIHTIQFFFPERMLPNVRVGAEYNEKDNTLTVLAEQAQGQFQVGIGESAADQIGIRVVLLEGMNALTKASLILTRKEEITMSASGGEARTNDGKIKLDFPQGVLPEDAIGQLGPPVLVTWFIRQSFQNFLTRVRQLMDLFRWPRDVSARSLLGKYTLEIPPNKN